MIEHNSFLIYKDHRALVDTCTDEQAGQLFKAIFAFACDGDEIQTDDKTIKAFFSVFKEVIIRNDIKYTETCEKRREAGRKGGLAKASNIKQGIANASKS